MLRAAPDDARALSGLADLRRSEGRFDDAIALRRRAHAGSDPSLEATLAGAWGERGYDAIVRASAEQTLDQLVMRKVAGRFVSALDFARLHAQLGRVAEAFAHLAEALDERAAGLVMLKVDPVWHALRGDSRFVAAVAHVGIP
jgi:tetratricopeptide (TPR) repeat protein